MEGTSWGPIFFVQIKEQFVFSHRSSTMLCFWRQVGKVLVLEKKKFVKLQFSGQNKEVDGVVGREERKLKAEGKSRKILRSHGQNN